MPHGHASAPRERRTGQTLVFVILALVIIAALIIAGMNLGKSFSRGSRIEKVKKPLQERAKPRRPAKARPAPAEHEPAETEAAPESETPQDVPETAGDSGSDSEP